MSYTHTVAVSLSYDDAVERTREALAEHGFGVLTEIDVRATFDKKLGADAAEAVGDYVILGACNPTLASKALAAEPELGALLPCNVVVRRGAGDDRTTIETIDPQTMVKLGESDRVREVADDADARLQAALADIAAGSDAGA
ncbi:DUF302 domain-containing protein [Corynebacterium halotolerans]|uniref:DUF302 domain-containing protein n=1 Tax=Corynebacterium halotolerans YIM 70093 = DSM 44683 TaxID=1121362 RepID=M1P317_9CORY|nr:DUF302 domain-containing protein [Corynebacterium halotolerans]AGF71071.1 hypothetical protein A605_00275 [Corynebacterium halotolerans YIM 70093 = DSM 44683]